MTECVHAMVAKQANSQCAWYMNVLCIERNRVTHQLLNCTQMFLLRSQTCANLNDDVANYWTICMCVWVVGACVCMSIAVKGISSALHTLLVLFKLIVNCSHQNAPYLSRSALFLLHNRNKWIRVSSMHCVRVFAYARNAFDNYCECYFVECLRNLKMLTYTAMRLAATASSQPLLGQIKSITIVT